MTKIIFRSVALLTLALAGPASAQGVIVEEETVQAAPSAQIYDYEPGALQYYSAPRRRLSDRETAGRSSDEISPNETDHFYEQMDRENRGGSSQ